MKISIIGNCQLIPFAKELRKNNKVNVEFTSPYATIDKINEFLKTIKECDIFISTLTKNGHREDVELGTEFLISNLSSKTVSIVVPSVYYSGYFPTYGSYKEFDALNYNFETKSFYFSKYHDYLAINLADKGVFDFDYETLSKFNCDEIIEINQKKTFEDLREKEKKCDIIISDFIESISNKELCFYTYNHPHDKILFFLYNQILKKINFELNINFEQNNYLSNDKSYVHNFVLNYFNLKQNEFMNNEIFNKIINHYKDKKLEINYNSNYYINSSKILEKII